MAGSKILYVCQEITPYLPPTEISSECRLLVQAMQERGNETRTFMPRYGVINERRNQLHEVIRLSGMNLIIDDNDHQLIIKVASIPSARVQIYFIDNDDYFARKAVLRDPATDGMFPDNDERAIFFARGVLETVRKLRWEPTVVHCHGWFSAVMPIYLRNTFADDPMFQNLKIAVSIYDDAFPGTLDAGFRKKIENQFLSSFLYYVPYACLTALTLPAIFYSTESVISAIAGFVVAVILGIREKGLVVVAAAACVTVFVVERILAFL